MILKRLKPVISKCLGLMMVVKSFFLRTYSVPAIDQRNPRPGQAQHHLQPGTAEMHGGLTEEKRRRLGLHRPGVMMIFVFIKSPIACKINHC